MPGARFRQVGRTYAMNALEIYSLNMTIESLQAFKQGEAENHTPDGFTIDVGVLLINSSRKRATRWVLNVRSYQPS